MFCHFLTRSYEKIGSMPTLSASEESHVLDDEIPETVDDSMLVKIFKYSNDF